MYLWEILTAIGTTASAAVAVFIAYQNSQENKRQKQLGLFITTTQRDLGANDETGTGVIVNNSQVEWEVALEWKASFGFSQNNTGPCDFEKIMNTVHNRNTEELKQSCLEQMAKKKHKSAKKTYTLQPQEKQLFHIANIVAEKTLAHFAWLRVTQKSKLETKCVNYVYRYSNSGVLESTNKKLYNTHQPCNKWILEYSWAE